MRYEYQAETTKNGSFGRWRVMNDRLHNHLGMSCSMVGVLQSSLDLQDWDSPFPPKWCQYSVPPFFRYTASISPPSPPVVKDHDIEQESECEFLIDESDGLSSNSWFSIPQKNRKSKKDGSATPVTKSQSSEKGKTEGKKGKTGKVQAEALTEQKTHNLDVRMQLDFKGTSRLDSVSSKREGNQLKSQKQSSTHAGKLFTWSSES